MTARAIVLALLLAISSAAALAQDTIPIPRKPASYVTDRPKVLTAATRTALEEKLRKFNDDSGNQVVVWIGRTLPADVTIEEYANASFNLWGVGQKGKNNGVLLMLFVKSRKMRIETGDGVRDRISDARAAEIIEAMKPALRASDYAAAIGTATDSIVQALTPPPPPPPAPKPLAAVPPPAAPPPARESTWIDAAISCFSALLTFGLIAFLAVRIFRWLARAARRAVGSSGGGYDGSPHHMRVDHHHYRSGWGWGWGGGWGGSRSRNTNTVVNNVIRPGSSSNNDDDTTGGSNGGFTGGGGSSSGGGASGSW